ncbi:hypothetical protein VNO77_04174 [Canavalia gladiata]|uniref:Uncharacterized protein n=1 Tax=Canavalia gladiata TaxID=3824 RepID=A0AAN9R8T7_CANGL
MKVQWRYLKVTMLGVISAIPSIKWCPMVVDDSDKDGNLCWASYLLMLALILAYSGRFRSLFSALALKLGTVID